MAPNEAFDIDGPAGRLEALLMLPDTPAVAAAVVCHADPLKGGVMHFKVVFRAAKALQEAGCAVLRFNFRGVGRSEGEHDHGRGEQEDASAALDELERRFKEAPVLLGGFSFGSAVALRLAARQPRVRAVLALGFPCRLAGDVAFLASLTAPRLFVQGECDPFGDGAAIRELTSALPEPKELVVIPGADHFFGGRLAELQQAIRAWAARRPWQPA